MALILVFVGAGTVYAATRGAAWRLGYVETLNGYTTGVIGSRGAELFKVKNISSTSAARAIRAEGDSISATIYSKNTGGGAAAEFVTNAGKAPFKVNRPAKVANLNADLLDGWSSSAFRFATLGTGATESGVWALSGGTGGNPLLTINYRSLLSSALPEANTHYLTNGVFSTECPAYGQAAAGHLCVYEKFAGSMAFGYFFNPEDYVTGSGRTGFTMYMTSSAAGGNSLGVWTVGAPSSILSTSRPSSASSTGNTAGR